MSVNTPLAGLVQSVKHSLSTRLASHHSIGTAQTAVQIDVTLRILSVFCGLVMVAIFRAIEGWGLIWLCCLCVLIGSLWLLWRLRRGAVRLATYGLLALLIGVVTLVGVLGPWPMRLNATYYLVLVVAIASIVLNLRGLVVVVLVCMSVMAGISIFHGARPVTQAGINDMAAGLINVGLLLFSVSAIVVINNQNLQDALMRGDAHQQALATRNAELEQEIVERQRAVSIANQRSLELQRLLDASRVLSSTLELKPLTRGILSQLNQAIAFDAAMIWEFTGPSQYMILASVPESIDDGAGPLIRPIDERDAHLQALIQTREPVLIDDILADDGFARAQHARWMRVYGEVPAYLRSSLFLPLLVRDQMIGCIVLYSAIPGFFTPYLANLGMTFAAQIASAIAVVRSHERTILAATYSATMSERSRLARELHDSVSQALFGIVLGSSTMLTSADAGKPVTRDAMVYVLNLAQAALSEMRALIFELRPETLQTEGLLNVLRKQAQALAARHKLAVNTDFGEVEPSLSLESKEALYRIALEAVQNVIKHAGATSVELRLMQEPGRIRLEIQDDGHGFDPAGDFPGHIGLKTMAERAHIFGGRVQFISHQGHGTCVQVEMPLVM